MRAVLDTSVLIGEDAPEEVEAAISVASLTELHFGVLVATDDDERARRTDRLTESTFDSMGAAAGMVVIGTLHSGQAAVYDLSTLEP